MEKNITAIKKITVPGFLELEFGVNTNASPEFREAFAECLRSGDFGKGMRQANVPVQDIALYEFGREQMEVEYAN